MSMRPPLCFSVTAPWIDRSSLRTPLKQRRRTNSRQEVLSRPLRKLLQPAKACADNSVPPGKATLPACPVFETEDEDVILVPQNSVSKKPKDVDVVITHSSADFDSLAAAVGLAKLRGPRTFVVCPGGEGPSLRRFLALHRQLFQIVDPKTIDPQRLRWVGVVDTVRKDRLGLAAKWPAMADEVCVFDHHVGRTCDITNPKKLSVVVEAVGAVATLICERLQASQHEMTPAEATLLALAIHSDTGSLTFEHTTPRDAAALAWLMQNGAIQRSIAEFTHVLLTDEQQLMLSQGLAAISRRRVHGVEIGSVVLVGRQFLKGMSTVASDLLDLSNVDVLLLAYINCRGRRARRKKAMDDDAFCGPEQLKQVSVIGRARARVDGIDFNKLFATLGGGGHARAASASLKLTEPQAELLVEDLVDRAAKQLPKPAPVAEHMTRNVLTVFPSTPMKDARKIMTERRKGGLPVVDDYGVLQGMITMKEIRLAESKGDELEMRKPVAGWMHQNIVSLAPETPLYEASSLVAENSLGRLPVVDSENRLIGLLTRTDVLVAQRMWQT